MTRTLSAPVTVAFDYTRSTGPGPRPVPHRAARRRRRRRPYVGRARSSYLRRSTTRSPTRRPPTSSRSRPSARSRRGPGCRSRCRTSRSTGRSRSRWSPSTAPTRPFLHALDVASPDEVSTGMRVQVRWAEERVGAITDIACFEPAADASVVEERGRRASLETTELRTRSPASSRPSRSTTSTPRRPRSPRSTAASTRAGSSASAARRASKVYVPPRSACPVDGVADRPSEVELPDTGTVTTFCIVNVPFLGPEDHAAVRLGVRAARRRRHRLPAPDPRHPGRRGPDGHAGQGGLEAARGVGHHDREHRPLPPTGEPDADYDTYKQHL